MIVEAPFLNPLERLERVCDKAASKRVPTTSVNTAEQRVIDAIDAFFDQKFEPEVELKAQRKRMGMNCDDIDWERVKKNEALYISSKFNLEEYWTHQMKLEQHLLQSRHHHYQLLP